MSDSKDTCRHIPCRCEVPAGEKFCSDACRDAGANEVEIACECGHAICAEAATNVA